MRGSDSKSVKLGFRKHTIQKTPEIPLEILLYAHHSRIPTVAEATIRSQIYEGLTISCQVAGDLSLLHVLSLVLLADQSNSSTSGIWGRLTCDCRQLPTEARDAPPSGSHAFRFPRRRRFGVFQHQEELYYVRGQSPAWAQDSADQFTMLNQGERIAQNHLDRTLRLLI